MTFSPIPPEPDPPAGSDPPDGWECGDPALLAREMAVLQRSCHRLIWLDPLASRPEFKPDTVGLRAALPYVDDFIPCATVASLEEMAQRLGRL